MTDKEIVDHLIAFLENWAETPGWAEENAGYSDILRRIRELRCPK